MRWRWIIGIAAGLGLVLILAAYVFVSRYDFNTLKPQIAQAVQQATGRALTIEGDIAFKIGLTPALTVERVRFQNASWGSQPTMATIQRFDMQVAILPLLRKVVEIKRFRLIEPTILIETNASGRSNLEFTPPAQTGTAAPGDTEQGPLQLPGLALHELHMVRGQVTYRDGQTGVTYAVRLDDLTANAPTPTSPIKLRLNGTYNDVPFELQSTLGTLAALTAPDASWPLQVAAKLGDNTLAIDGTVQAPMTQRALNLKLTVQATDLQSVEKLTGTPLAIREPLRLTGQVRTPKSDTYDIADLTMALGANELTGTVTARLTDPRPQVTAAFTSTKLDLRSLMAPPETSTTPPAPPAPRQDKVFPADPLPLEGLKQVDAEVTLQIKQLLTPRVALNDLSIAAKLHNGHVLVQPVKALIGGGPLAANLDLQPQGKAAVLATELTMKQFDIGRMLKELEITDLIDGTIDVDVNLKGHGASVAEIMSTLNGATNMVMGEGRFNNKYIALLGDLSTNLLRLINPFDPQANHTTINCFVNRIDIKDGLADVRALVFDTSTVSIVGNGSVNLKTEKLDLALKPHAKQGTGIGGVAKGTVSVGELAKPFKLGGTLAQPALTLDPLETAALVGKIADSVATFGTAGIAAALLSGSTGEQNRCLAALETAASGKQQPAEPQPGGGSESTTQEILKAPKDVGKTLKQLFGR